MVALAQLALLQREYPWLPVRALFLGEDLGGVVRGAHGWAGRGEVEDAVVTAARAPNAQPRHC